jgi:hypothetical protein
LKEYQIGQKIGRWTLLSYVPGNGKSSWFARCECGKEKIVRSSSLRTSQSCGCGRKNRLRHGHAGSRSRSSEYRAWQDMKSRCLNPKTTNYQDYGGRGITVCERWMNSFETFLQDMGKKPAPDYSLDRRKNNGPYDPQNCQWATRDAQLKNRRCYRAIENFSDDILQTEIWRRTPEYGLTGC